VYFEQTQGREFVDRARADLPMDRVACATEVGSRMTIKQALDLARIADSSLA
jgi:hypothetical protein